ncbi:TIGR03086 family metal-binding protein [Streptomyces tanashiensis]|uniref:TIGR03086 family protein n=1 Tax=Streptomyces tanashiensis TaxID=67367 RepID=A0ABY6QWX1_9ACTN|nr:TIGR03086 family metal-binding protein [Streptomyces tanashiensis]UZX20984.1 TIGR03086 family protein [Streptomyces tanashiensis]GGY52802.1 TIGR03086 family protein [Streptomyces tanashiensis]
MNEIHTHLTVCAAEASRVARAVTPEQLGTPSVCADWTVRELANHLVLYSAHGLEHRALRTKLPEETTGRDFTAEPDWAEAYAAQLDRALAAWERPGVWDGEVDTGYVTMPATTIASLLVKELALHGWDLARSTGQEFTVPEDTAAFVLGVVEEHAEVYRQYEGFAAVVDVPDDAPAFVRALAISGRNPKSQAV